MRILLLLASSLAVAWAQGDPTSINFGIGAIVPATGPYVPLTREQRLTLYLNDAYRNPSTWMRSVAFSVIDQRNGDPPVWGSGAAGFSRRWGSRFGRSLISNSIEHGGSAISGLEPRFIRCRCEGFGRRALHASSLDLLTYNRDMKVTFNWPRMLGVSVSELASSHWSPAQKWSAEGVRGVGQQLVSGLMFNMLREFGPELKRLLPGRKKR